MQIEVPGFIGQPAITIMHPDGAYEPGMLLATCVNSSGSPAYQLRVQRHCLVRWVALDRYSWTAGELLANIVDPQRMDFATLGLWMSNHAAFRAIEAHDGQGGQVVAQVIPIHGSIALNAGWEPFLDLLAGVRLEPGDIVVLADKPVAIAMGRVIPLAALNNQDPKFFDQQARQQMAEALMQEYQHPLTARHMLLIDHIDAATVSLGAYDHNTICAELAHAIAQRLNVGVDVVIADSDTGVDSAVPLIGIPTVGATPLGATAGLSLYETLRASAASEYVRGHTRGIPLVICRPSRRNQSRPAIGQPRPYRGLLHSNMEPELHRGVQTPIYWEVAG